MASPVTAFAAQGLVYALSVTNAQVNAIQPTGFTSGGCYYQIFNSGTNPVTFLAFLNSAGVPTLTFPVTGAPPTGQLGTVIGPGVTIVVAMPANSDSFCAIGSVAGPAIIYVQRGEGL